LSREDLEAEVLAIARRDGKFVAVKRYREATGAGARKARAAVEEILWRHGVFSMTRPRIRNWGGALLLTGSALAGAVIAWVLIRIFG
jgi:hypothetical protein